MNNHDNPFSNYTLPSKMAIAWRVFRNWPTVLLDRLGLVRHIHCHTRMGPVISCRGGESDSGDVAVIFSGRRYPPEVLQFETFPDEATVWDLGANIGVFSVWVDRLLRGTLGKRLSLVCVEPAEPNLHFLRENLALNGLCGVFVFEGVVGPEDGQAYLDTNRKMDAIRVSSEDTGIRVKQITLDSLFALSKSRRIDLLKMDIEGSEYAVLSAAKAFVVENVDRLIVEVHGKKADPTNPLWALFEEAFDVSAVAENILFFRSRRLPGAASAQGAVTAK